MLIGYLGSTYHGFLSIVNIEYHSTHFILFYVLTVYVWERIIPSSQHHIYVNYYYSLEINPFARSLFLLYLQVQIQERGKYLRLIDTVC